MITRRGLLFAIVAPYRKASASMSLYTAIPQEVREYLNAGDGLGQFAVRERHPNLNRTLEAADTRAALLRYLGSDEPWQEPAPGFVMSAVAFLQGKASAAELPTIEKLRGYNNPWVRVRVADYAMGVYFPAQNRIAMVQLWERMLNDADEIVRVHAARYVQSLKAAPAMRPFLETWQQTARQKKWDAAESYQLIEQSLR